MTNHTHHMHEHSEINENMPKSELLALLKYMAEHNRHHAEELHEIAHNTNDAAAAFIHAAIDQYLDGTDKLEEAIKLIEAN